MTKQEATTTLCGIARDNVFRFSDEQQEAIVIAIECIEKQIPKKPITIDDGWRYWDCPTCGARVGENMNFRYYSCLCGQLIDWSDDDDE